MTIQKTAFTVYLPSLGDNGQMGGAERAATTIAEEVARRGMPAFIVVNSIHPESRIHVPRGVRLVELRARGSLTAVLKLTFYRWRQRPPFVLSFMSIPNVINVLSGVLGPPGSRKRIISERSSKTVAISSAFPGRGPRVRHLFCRAVYPFAHGMIACSGGVAEAVRTVHPRLRDKTTTIGNPVRVRSETEASHDVHPWLLDDSVPCLISVGKLIRPKDHATLLRAVALVRETVPVRCLILGEGPLREPLLLQARMLQVDDVVSFIGHRHNPRDYVRMAAVYVHTSAWEGMPNSILEALAEGVPTVATDCETGPRELLDGCPSSRLVPVGQHEAVANAVIELLREQGNRTLIRSHAMKFDPSGIADKYLAAIRGMP